VWLVSFEVSYFSCLYVLGASANESGEKHQTGSNLKQLDVVLGAMRVKTNTKLVRSYI